MAVLNSFIFGLICASTSLAVADDAAQTAVVASMSRFAADFYKQVASGVSDNLILSPISADVVLSMTAYGARGNTANEMFATLYLTDRCLAKSGYQSTIDTLNAVKTVQLSVANRIFTATGFVIKSKFKELTATSFRSGAQSVNFNNREEASGIINAWCEEQTNDRIKDVIKPDDLVGVVMVLVNAVYFKGNWALQFNSTLTVPRPFNVDDKTTTNVPTMYQKSRFNYGDLPDLDATYVELPYVSSNDSADSVTMFIIIPNTLNGLKQAQDNVDKMNLKQLHDSPRKVQAELYLPKFKIESSIDLKPILEKLGMIEMFTDTANFTGIADRPPLKIGKVIQKAFIEVNEEGSEAAAVTAAVGVTATAIQITPKPTIIRVDRPFHYVIHHSSTNTVLFAGHVTSPNSQ